MKKKVKSLSLDQNRTLRSECQSPEARLKEIWEAGLKSSVAGDMDDVFDRVLKTLNSAGHVM